MTGQPEVVRRTSGRPGIFHARFFTVVHLRCPRQASEEEMKIAAQDDVRRKPRDRVWLDTIDQVAAESLKGESSLRKRTLIQSGKNLT